MMQTHLSERKAGKNIPEEVKFVAKVLRLFTSSARFLLFHYVEGDQYQLPLLNSEVTMKVSRDAYSILLLMLKAEHFIMTVQGNTVITIAPFQELKPIPSFSIDRTFKGSYHTRGIHVTSTIKTIKERYERLMQLPYHAHHKKFGEDHKIWPRNMVSFRILDCGCCATLLLKDYADCEKFCSQMTDVSGRILGYWALFRENVPIQESFNVNLVGDNVKVSNGTGVHVDRPVSEILKDLMVSFKVDKTVKRS